MPGYNVEDYIERAVNSVLNQSEKDFELIIVNDGSTDNTKKICDSFKDKKIKVIHKKNGGLSDARNEGVKKATGEYIIFMDSDDYWDKDLLKEISKSLDNNPDVVRFQIREVTDKNESTDYSESGFKNKSGEEAFNLITKYHFVENAWAYAIKREYYLKEKFEFKKGAIHEDYGLTPLIIIKASIVNSISYIGYNYCIRSNSLMTNKDYEKVKKKVKDFYEHYLYLNEEIDKVKVNKTIFKSFIANSVILKICELKGKDYKEYKKKLKKDRVIDNILSDTFGRKIKKIIIRISPRLYSKVRSK
jgi:glycosyltransferase involved in cell wall biosynthesis